MPNRILLVDGYNVIHKLPETRAGLEISLERARETLVFLTAKWKASHPGFECIIVFDGRDRGAARRRPEASGVKCVFSASPHGADEHIVQMVKTSPRPSDITVVSDDNFIHNNGRAHGALIRNSGYLLEKTPGRSKARKGISPDGKGLDGRAAGRINAEMRKAWTSEEKD